MSQANGNDAKYLWPHRPGRESGDPGLNLPYRCRRSQRSLAELVRRLQLWRAQKSEAADRQGNRAFHPSSMPTKPLSTLSRFLMCKQ